MTLLNTVEGTVLPSSIPTTDAAIRLIALGWSGSATGFGKDRWR